MGWDANLTVNVDGHDIDIPNCDWNYTHNLNHAIVAALGNPDVGTYWVKNLGGRWWDLINNKKAGECIHVFDTVIKEFTENKELYIQYEPDNGWGDLETLTKELEGMRNAANKYPSAIWRVYG